MNKKSFWGRPRGADAGDPRETAQGSSMREEIFVAVFRNAAHEYMENDFIKGMDDPELKDLSCSETFERDMTQRIRRFTASQRRVRALGTLKKAAAGIAVFLAVCGALAFSVDAVRMSFYNFLIETKEWITEINPEATVGPTVPAKPPNYYPTYIPAGYELSSSSMKKETTRYIFVNEDGIKLNIIVFYNAPSAGIDTEDSAFTKILVGEQDAYYSEKDGYITLIVNCGQDSYRIAGQIELDEAINIAESMLD